MKAELELTGNELIKLAQNNAAFRAKVIAEMGKIANGNDDDKNGAGQFNEKVPATEEGDENGKGKQPPQQPPQAPPGEEAAAVPIPQPEAAPEGPEAVGARAAQAFIGPEVMSAAMQGDPAAQDIISRTAGQVAGAVAESNARAAAGSPTQAVPAVGEVGADPSATGAEGVPAAGAPPVAPVASPADELATEIAGAAPAPGAVAPGAPAPGAAPVGIPGKDGQAQVAPQPPAGAQPAPAPGGAAPKSNEGKLDAAAVAKLLELAKAGKI